jgi:hypothetical protein
MLIKDEREPDALYYFRRAAEDMEDDLKVTLYYLARGLLRLAESLTVRADRERAKGATDAEMDPNSWTLA